MPVKDIDQTNLLVRAMLAFFYSISPALFTSLLMCAVIHLVEIEFPYVSRPAGLDKIPLGGLVYVLVFWYVFRGRSQALIKVSMRLMGRQ